MTAKTFTEFLKHAHIANYIAMRINDHAYLYEHRIDGFVFHHTHEALFRLLYVLLARHLAEGHTVIRFDETTLKSHLLQPSIDMLAEFLEMDVQAWVDRQIDISNMMSDDIEMLETEQAYQAQERIIIRKSRAKNLDKMTIDLLLEFALDVARLAYVLSKQNFAQFCQRLSHHPLITLDEPSGRVPQLPIVLRLNTTKQAYLWLQRAWQAEHDLACYVQRLASMGSSGVGAQIALRPDFLAMKLNQEQRQVIISAFDNDFTVITGGPGTGKTHTLARLVMLLLDGWIQVDKIALVAPTGKAAQRMHESLTKALGDAGLQIQLPEAKTIHRLLGIGVDGQARYNSNSPLNETVIIVDEASMLGVELACALFAAVPVGGKVILLGDVNQLAAVEAGAVLADLCKTSIIEGRHVALVESTRFGADSGIGRLADAIQAQDARQAMSIINAAAELDFIDVSNGEATAIYEQLMQGYQPFFDVIKNHIHQQVTAADVEMIFNQFHQYRILCASHLGDYGDDKINEYLLNHHKNLLKAQVGTQKNRSNFWYHGKAIMVNKNDYALGLFNGDIGICLGVDYPKVYFEHKPEGIDVGMMSEEMVDTAYAMTVHKSQGSEFAHVAVVFDESNIRLLTKELIYTAITRAKTSVAIYSTNTAFDLAIATPTERQTGLDLHL